MLDSQNELQLIPINDRGVKFINERMELWLNLYPDPEFNGRDWYGGSVTSVLLDQKEILDPFTAELPWLYMNHDIEKRCMQVDKLQLWDEHGTVPVGQQVVLCKGKYELLSQKQTQNNISVTIASEPFEIDYPDSFSNKKSPTVFRLFRTLLLDSGSDLVKEELYVKGYRLDREDDLVFPRFSPHYFTYIAFKQDPVRFWDVNAPWGFAFGCPWGFGPFPGYGFASSVSILGDVEHPDPLYPCTETGINTFSWQLAPCKSAECVHLFMRYEPNNFYSRIEDCWKAMLSSSKSELREEEVQDA